MGILINSSDTKAIKQLWILLHLIAILSGAIGVSTWFITPFLTREIKSNQWHQLFRWASVIGGISCGGISLSSSLVLSSLEPKIKALDKYELAQFKHAVASQLFLAQQTHSAIASSLAAEQHSFLGNSQVELWNSTQSNSSRETLPGWSFSETPESSATETELNQQNEAVLIALRDGIPDSEIVKTVMGYTGRRYQEGKEILEAIKLELMERKLEQQPSQYEE